MSDIDTIEHFFIGYFYSVPVYQPLEVGCIDSFRFCKNRNNIAPGKLIIGGGDGEHPAIIFHDLEFCVAKWLLYYFSDDELPKEILVELTDRIKIPHLRETLEYCKWDNETHRNFFNNCTCGYSIFSDEMSFEEWLILNIGEFVYISLYNISDTISKWNNKIGEIGQSVSLFVGVMILPPGYRNVFGLATNPSTLKKENGINRFSVTDNWPDYHKKESG